MGYEIRITRTDRNADAPIAIEEWRAALAADPEMREDGVADAALPGGDVLRCASPGLAVWTAYSGHGIDGNMAWFDHRDGEIVVKNPDAEIRAKMWRLAQTLGARVLGEEDEPYGADGDPSDAATARESVRSKPWWKFRR